MDTHGQFQALVIGVGDYLFYSDIPETASDAKSISSILVDEQRCGYACDHVRTCIGAEATKEHILAGLSWLAENAKQNATTLIYFSGHGGYSAIDPASMYLCSHEADWRNLTDTAISAEVFSKALKAINTARLVVIVDACHSGGIATFKGGDHPEHYPQWKGLSRDYYEKFVQGSGRIILASSQASQVSWTHPESKMSLFTFYLLDGLKGKAAVYNDGLIRVLDLFTYVSDSIRRKNALQEPILAAQDLTLNFPIALYQGGKRWGHQSLPIMAGIGKGGNDMAVSQLVEIRKQLESPRMQTQNAGVEALLRYLALFPTEILLKLDIDLEDNKVQQVRFKRLIHDITVYGEDPGWIAQQFKSLSSFLNLVARLEKWEDGNEF